MVGYISIVMLNLLLLWLVPSIIAAIVIMLLDEIIEHRLEFKGALLLGFGANILPILINNFYPQIYSYIPYASLIIGSMSLGSIVINLTLWIGLAVILIREAEITNRIKIGALGFIITEVLFYILFLI